MSIWKTVFIWLLVAFFVAVLCFGAYILYLEEIRTEEIHTLRSPDGNYTVEVFQVGSPGWSFGPVKARLILSDNNGETLDRLDISLNNDGSGVDPYNINDIRWLDHTVELDIQGFDDQKPVTYILRYADN